MSKPDSISSSKQNQKFDFTRKAVESFFGFKAIKGYVDEVRVTSSNVAHYYYDNLGIASLYGSKLNLCCIYRPTYGILKRYEEIVKVVKERYGIDIAVSTAGHDILLRIGNDVYVFFGCIDIDLEKRQIVENRLAARVYPADVNVEKVADVVINNDFVLTIGIVNGELVAKLTKYDVKTIKKISIKLHFEPPFDPLWLTLFWIPLQEKKIQIKDTLEMIDKSAPSKLESILKQYGLA